MRETRNRTQLPLITSGCSCCSPAASAPAARAAVVMNDADASYGGVPSGGASPDGLRAAAAGVKEGS